MAAQVYEFEVDMTCEGCSNAVKRVLGKLGDVEKVDIDLAQKRVVVTTSLASDQIKEQLLKTGKAVNFLGTKSA